MKKLPLRPNVCMLVINKRNRLFLGERNGEPGVWQFPQGGAEPQLTLEENVIKELHEELGANRKLFKIVKKLKSIHDYEFSNPPAYAKNKWRGQSQTFWLVKFSGTNKDINLKRYHPEMMNFKWCTAEQVLELAEKKRIRGYRKALREFERYLAD